MSYENSIPSGMPTIPSSVITTMSRIGGWFGNQQRKNNKVRVTSVNLENGDILFEPLYKNVGKSNLGNPTGTPASIDNNVQFSVPKVGEIVELYNCPGIDQASNQDQASNVFCYRPSPINVWKNQNNNIVLTNNVAGQAPETPMANISLDNYQNTLNGFF